MTQLNMKILDRLCFSLMMKWFSLLKKIPQKIIQQIQDKLWLRNYYKGRILRGIKTDESLVKQINDEIGATKKS